MLLRCLKHPGATQKNNRVFCWPGGALHYQMDASKDTSFPTAKKLEVIFFLFCFSHQERELLLLILPNNRTKSKIGPSLCFFKFFNSSKSTKAFKNSRPKFHKVMKKRRAVVSFHSILLNKRLTAFLASFHLTQKVLLDNCAHRITKT